MLLLSNWLVFIALVIGFTYLITESLIFRLVRIPVMTALLAASRKRFAAPFAATFGRALYCPSCMAFWVGAVLSTQKFYPHAAANMVLTFAEAGIVGIAIGATWSKALGTSDTFGADMNIIASAAQSKLQNMLKPEPELAREDTPITNPEMRINDQTEKS